MNDENSSNAELVGGVPVAVLNTPIFDLLEEPANVSFFLPYQYTSSDGLSGNRPHDPMTIYWSADVSGADERITYKTSLKKLLDDAFEGHELWGENSGQLSADAVPIFAAFRSALQCEIDRINNWIANAKEDQDEDN